MKFAELSSETQIVWSGKALAWIIHEHLIEEAACHSLTRSVSFEVALFPSDKYVKNRVFLSF